MPKPEEERLQPEKSCQRGHGQGPHRDAIYEYMHNMFADVNPDIVLALLADNPNDDAINLPVDSPNVRKGWIETIQ